MPTYEYACPKCGIVEFFQSMKESALTRCPTCKTAKVTRLMSCGAGIIFKGSGFWETDYNRSSDYQAKSKQEKGSTPAESDATASPAPDAKSKSNTKPQLQTAGTATTSTVAKDSNLDSKKKSA